MIRRSSADRWEVIPILSVAAESRLPRAVTIHAIHIDTVRGMDWEPVCKRLPERMEKAKRYRHERDRLLCVGAGILLLKCVEIRDESELRYGMHGKMYAPGHSAFSLSHSGDWCVLATGAADIGVDIERIDSANLQVAPLVFTPAERSWMQEKPVESFHILWTLKESVMKATGLGMRLKAESFEVLPFCFGAPIALLGRTWYAATGTLDSHRYSVCASYPIKADITFPV